MNLTNKKMIRVIKNNVGTNAINLRSKYLPMLSPDFTPQEVKSLFQNKYVVPVLALNKGEKMFKAKTFSRVFRDISPNLRILPG
jgi:hypothetical protein